MDQETGRNVQEVSKVHKQQVRGNSVYRLSKFLIGISLYSNFMCMDVLPAYVSVYHVCTRCLREIPGNGVPGGYEPPCGC